MNDDTLFALEQAIRHWKANRDAKSHCEVRFGVFACSLCHLFVDNDYCKGCPVSAFTGAPGCSGTPYSAASFAYGSWKHASLYGGDEKTTREAWVSAAQAEIDFLESLLPKEKVAL